MTSSQTPEEATEERAKWFDLNPDRDLLDPNFNGYKLSLDTFSHYKLDISQHELNTHNNQSMLLFQHLKLIGLQNLMIVNQFNDADAYYFDSDSCLVRIAYKETDTRAIFPTNLQLKHSGSDTNRVNVTMKFTDANTAAIFDGYETIYLCKDNGNDQWTELFQFSTSNVARFGVACVLKDAALLDNKLHLLFVNVQEKEGREASLDTLINWLMFEREVSDGVWSMRRLRRLNCANSVPDYVALETNCQSVFVAGVDTIRYVIKQSV